jgi:hypothetical protein
MQATDLSIVRSTNAQNNNVSNIRVILNWNKPYRIILESFRKKDETNSKKIQWKRVIKYKSYKEECEEINVGR